MKTITEMPEKPETKICEKHGEYEFKYTQMPNNKIWVLDGCSDCIKETTEARESAERIELEKIRVRQEKNTHKSKRVNAGISKRNLYKTFDDYICQNEGQQRAKNSCLTFVESFPSDKSLLMLGSVGTGKTLLASAMIERLIDKNKCTMVKVIDIVRGFKNTWRKDSEHTEGDVAEYYIGLDLLIIDEVGTQFGSDMEKLFIFEIIDGRYQEMKPTILISNLDVEGVKEVIGERCLDRLRDGGGSMIAFNWESSRA